jgi:hypothetical protein
MVIGFGLTAASASAVTVSGPLNTVAPVISGYTSGGAAVENNTLTVDNGTWTDATDSNQLVYTYAWFDANGNSLGNGNTYQIQSSDIGRTIHATVSATDTNNDGDSADSASSTTVIASDVSNTTPPVLSGSASPNSTLSVTTGSWTGTGLLAISYDWGYTAGQSGGQLTPPDATSTHTINADDFGVYLVVLVTATDSNGHQATVRETTATVVTPAPPFPTDAGFTSANEGSVTDTQTTTSATITDPDGTVGDTVFVYGYSTPTPLGFYVLDANKQIVVPFTGLATGNHTLAVIDANGLLVGWLSVRAGNTLASTGVNVNAPLELGGAGLLILLGILSVVYVTRQRRKTA